MGGVEISRGSGGGTEENDPESFNLLKDKHGLLTPSTTDRKRNVVHYLLKNRAELVPFKCSGWNQGFPNGEREFDGRVREQGDSTPTDRFRGILHGQDLQTKMSGASFSLIWKSASEFRKKPLRALNYLAEGKAGGSSGRPLTSLCR
jgi:hypothetical protein